MADLKPPSDQDRGQLILVTGFAIAVTIIALVLLLNSAIYTQNLATRGTDIGADDALAHRDTVDENLWPVIEAAANNDAEATTRAEVEANVTARLERFDVTAAQPHLARGASTDVTVTGFDDGMRLRQTDTSRQLTSDSLAPNWTLVDSTNDVRQFELNTTGGLAQTSTPKNESFRMVVNGTGGDQWRVYVYNDSTPTLAVKNGSSSINKDICSDVVTGPPRVNPVAGTVNGVDCPALSFGEGTSPPYRIGFVYGNRTTGTYDAIVNGTTVASSNFDSHPTSPYTLPVVYGVETRLSYQSAELTYRSQGKTTPAPPSGGRTFVFAKDAGATVEASDGDTLRFRIENAADERVTVEQFEVDATAINASMTLDNGTDPELSVQQTGIQDGTANRSGSFEANGTQWYDLVGDSTADGQYAIIDSGAGNVAVSVGRFSQPVGTLTVTYAESEADLTVTLVLSDGTEEVFYFDEQ
ncbi:DUF7261 family protein [Haloplanus halobius]|uniref:DUF7261 family protein n=1 Tax=Haloplanus halobius TaxID=2934938 RepID=UPI00200D8C54|nr:hypothetical protein [Haloplanus sp. XH21]